MKHLSDLCVRPQIRPQVGVASKAGPWSHAGTLCLVIAALSALQACGGGDTAAPDTSLATPSSTTSTAAPAPNTLVAAPGPNTPAAPAAPNTQTATATPTTNAAPAPNAPTAAPTPNTPTTAAPAPSTQTATPAPNTQTAALPATSQLVQYTPNQANWSTFATKPFTAPNTAHDPDGVGWITPAQWAASKWDGTIYNPSKMSKAEFAGAICPSVDRVRGIREVFYKHKPFADNKTPTKAEIDEWHRIAINHVRALIGYTSVNRQVQKDHCMFARALWGDERKFTTKWDTKYPGTLGSAFGPCQGSANAHCGATFLPDLKDQASYLPQGHPGCGTPSGAEGVFNGPKSNIPWSIKWSRGLCNTLLQEGFWGGHVGPWFHREKFGLSFWDTDPSNNNNNAILRGKWTGNLMPNLYCNPADPACDPNKPVLLP